MFQVLERGRTRSEGGPDRRPVSGFGRWLTLIAACGLVLRVVVVVHARNEWVVSDGYWYSLQANQMAHGRLFVDPLTGRPDALHPPAWVVLLTAFAWLGGHTWLQQQLLACAIGTLTVVLVGLAGRRLAGDRAGLVAAGIAAVYAGLWVYEHALLSETLLLPVIAVMVLIAYRFRERPSAALAALLGATCGLLALTRSEQVLLLFLLVVPLILAAKGIEWRRRLGWLGLATISLAVVVGPWTVYNLQRFQQPVVLSTGLGYAAVQGNCDEAYYGPNTGGTDGGCQFRAAVQTAKSRDASVAEAADRRIALTYAEHHWTRLPVVLVAREGRTFGFWAPLRQSVLDQPLQSNWSVFLKALPTPQHRNLTAGSDLWVGRLGLFSYWLLLVPAVGGAVVLRRRSLPIYPLLAFVVTILIGVALTIGETRYRASAEISLVLLAAVGVDAILPSKRPPPSGCDDAEMDKEESSPAGRQPVTIAADGRHATGPAPDVGLSWTSSGDRPAP